MQCPFCPGTAELKSEIMPIRYRKREIWVDARYYQCNRCNEDFTTTELDEYTLGQVTEIMDAQRPKGIKSSGRMSMWEYLIYGLIWALIACILLS